MNTIVNVIDSVSEKILSEMVVSEQPVRIATEDLSLQLSRQPANEIGGSEIQTLEGVKLRLPKNMLRFESNNTAVKSKVCFYSFPLLFFKVKKYRHRFTFFYYILM